MEDMKARMTIRGKGEAEQFVRKQMRQYISNIEPNIEKTVQMYGQQSRARAGRAEGKTKEEGQELAQ